MSLVPAKCTQCGATIKVDSSRDAGICEYCGTAFVTEKVINNYNSVYNIENAVINVQGANIENILKRAQNFEKNNDIDRAIEYYEKVLDIDAENAVAKSAIKKLTQFYIGPFKFSREDAMQINENLVEWSKLVDGNGVAEWEHEFEIEKIIAKIIKPIYFDLEKDFLEKYAKIGVSNEPFSFFVERDSVTSEIYEEVIEYEKTLADEIEKQSGNSLRLPPRFEKYFYYNFVNGEKNNDGKSSMKILQAIRHYANLSKCEIPLFVFDHTLTGVSDEGFLVTTKGIHIKNDFQEKIFLKFADINRVEYKGLFFKNFYINDVKIETAGVSDKDIKSAIEAIEEYKNTFSKIICPL